MSSVSDVPSKFLRRVKQSLKEVVSKYYNYETAFPDIKLNS